MKSFTLLFAAMTVIGGHAMAQDAAPQYYVSGGIQNTKTDTTDANLNSVTVKLGSRFNTHLGLEGDLAFGTSDNKGVKLTQSAAVYGVGYWPVTEQFDLLGRVGVGDTKLKGAGKLDSGTSFNYGVGAQYHFNPDMAVRFDLTRADYINDKGQSDTATLSVVKKF